MTEIVGWVLDDGWDSFKHNFVTEQLARTLDPELLIRSWARPNMPDDWLDGREREAKWFGYWYSSLRK